MSDPQAFPLITQRVCTGIDPNTLTCTMPPTHIHAEYSLDFNEILENGIDGTPTWMIQPYSSNTVHTSIEYREFVSYEKGTALFRYHAGSQYTIEHPNCERFGMCIWEAQGVHVVRDWEEQIHIEEKKNGESYYVIDRFLKSGFIEYLEPGFEGVATWMSTPLPEESYRILFPINEVPAKFQELIWNYELRRNS